MSIISGSDPALHVLQHGEPEPQLGAGHPGDGQLPPDRLPHQGLRHLRQREVGVVAVQCKLVQCTAVRCMAILTTGGGCFKAIEFSRLS
jgi:hypothetical protein